jgi:hypothetical protein
MADPVGALIRQGGFERAATSGDDIGGADGKTVGWADAAKTTTIIYILGLCSDRWFYCGRIIVHAQLHGCRSVNEPISDYRG